MISRTTPCSDPEYPGVLKFKGLTAGLLCALIIAGIPCMTAAASPRTVSDIPVPAGYTRILAANNSYAAFLRSIKLKQNTTILAWNGGTIDNSRYRVLAVAQIPLLFKKDIEQCADWAMRLWGEYFVSIQRTDLLYLFDYNGRKKFFRESGLRYAGFLEKTFISANSYSLKRGCKKPSVDPLPGAMLVQNENGGIGHVTVLLDACENRKGERLYLAGFSFMPAQEFHIERGEHDGWFTLTELTAYLDEYFPYGKPELREFTMPVLK